VVAAEYQEHYGEHAYDEQGNYIGPAFEEEPEAAEGADAAETVETVEDADAGEAPAATEGGEAPAASADEAGDNPQE
jgi:small subunit ribosomal protein S1